MKESIAARNGVGMLNFKARGGQLGVLGVLGCETIAPTLRSNGAYRIEDQLRPKPRTTSEPRPAHVPNNHRPNPSVSKLRRRLSILRPTALLSPRFFQETPFLYGLVSEALNRASFQPPTVNLCPE